MFSLQKFACHTRGVHCPANVCLSPWHQVCSLQYCVLNEVTFNFLFYFIFLMKERNTCWEKKNWAAFWCDVMMLHRLRLNEATAASVSSDNLSASLSAPVSLLPFPGTACFLEFFQIFQWMESCFDPGGLVPPWSYNTEYFIRRVGGNMRLRLINRSHDKQVCNHWR